MLSKLSTPHLYSNTYTDNVEGFLLVYNPISEHGISILNKEAAFLFNLIDGKKKLDDFFNLAKKESAEVEFHDIERVFNDFFHSEIIFFDSPKNKNIIFQKPPKHLGVWLHVTNQCNLRCKYCYVRKTNEKMNKKTGVKAIQNIIRDAKKNNFKKITIKFSGGECLLEFNYVLELIKLTRTLAKKADIKSDFVVLTNGVLLSEKIANTLKEKKIRAAISLDGLQKYNDNRVFPSGKSSFSYVEKGINNLLKIKVPFNVSITITSKNIENIPDLTKYLLKRNIPFAFNFYRENPYVKEELEGDDKKLVKYLREAYLLIYNNPPRYSLINGLLDRVTFSKPHLYTCGMGNSYIVVRQDGRIVPCQMTLEKPIGSIDDLDLIKTMKDGNFVKPIGLTVEGKNPCHTCQWKYICCGGCPLLTFKQKGKYIVNSPCCAVYKALIPEVLRIEAKRLIKYGIRDNEGHIGEMPSQLPL
ncbi:radical SAM protein [Patescibacteria group bacterium]|nr:radical SAM protein [Patescibacteria group bacterium]MBU1885197.1 radical SAM protein [Patescibacteria group bacterium]